MTEIKNGATKDGILWFVERMLLPIKGMMFAHDVLLFDMKGAA